MTGAGRTAHAPWDRYSVRSAANGREFNFQITALGDLSKRLEALERNVSYDRRALHVVIDRLQAEIVERYKSGRASVDGLLS